MELPHFAKRVSARVRRETGLEMNLHLFRHLAAKIFLDAPAGQYEAVRHLLGHAASSSALSAYTGFEAGTPTRLYSEIISEAQRRLT